MDDLLTHEQKAKLAAGECPGITGEGVCPVSKDDIIPVRSDLTIRVVGVERGGDIRAWRLRYEVLDKRQTIRLLRRTPPVVPPRGEETPDAEVIRRAARESSYTSSSASAISDAGEAVDEATQDRFTKDAREAFRRDLEAERKRREKLKPYEALRLVLEDADRRGVDVSGDLRVIKKRIDAMKRKADAA